MTIPPAHDKDARRRFGRFEIQRAERQLVVAGKPAILGSRAFDLLLALCDRADRVVPKNELIDLVWPGLVVEDNNLQVQISSLRKLLGREAIATIPGRGYQFTATCDAQSPREHGLATHAESLSLPSTTAPNTAPVSLAGNLRDVLPRLYGRDDDIAALAATTKSYRLVTLVGAGGIGKTRLALAVAHQQKSAWEDGVWFVELAPCTDAALVPGVIAQTLGIKLVGVQPAQDEVVSALRGMTLFLVLDNCEHLLDACAALVSAVLAQAAGVKILVTSQEALHLPDEQQFRANPLTIPADATVAGASAAGAVALFAARARSADPRFELTTTNLEAVIEICRRLDGIALAIELAAARVPLLGVEGVRARLDDRFKVLTAGARVALRRHQTLRATVEWSHALLSVDEQAVLRRLGVFVGSFALASAQYVASDDRIDEWAALDLLGALVDKSMVVVEPSAEPRYRLLETTRAFALEQLQECGETATTLRRHAQAIRALFERAWEARWLVPVQVRLTQYLPDFDNLRAALDWAATTSDDANLLIALTGSSEWLWFTAAPKPEAVKRFHFALRLVNATTPPALEARLQHGYSHLSDASPTEAFMQASERAVFLFRALGDRENLFRALADQTTKFASCGNMASAEHVYREAESMFDASWPAGLRAQIVMAKTYFFWFRGDAQNARLCNAKVLELAREANDEGAMLNALIFEEQIAASCGDLEQAICAGREILSDMTSRFSRSKSIALGNLSAALTELGHIDEALSTARECVPIKMRDGSLWIRLDAFSLLAFKRGHTKTAALVLGCSDAVYTTKNHPRQPNEARVHDLAFAALQNLLAKPELETLMTEGGTLAVEEAARIALAD